MDSLKQILCEEVQYYAGSGRGANLRLFAVCDDHRQVYTVTAVDYPLLEESVAGVVVLARVYDDQIVIEADGTDKPLIDALLQRGVPREKIILAYRGEPIPDAALFTDG